jgi:Toprim-like
MTYEEANKIPITEIANALGMVRTSGTSANVQYQNPHIEDKSGNLNCCLRTNKCKDFADSKPLMTTIDLIIFVKNCAPIDALRFCEQHTGASIAQPQPEYQPLADRTLHSAKRYEWNKYPANDNYILSRGISRAVAEQYLYNIVLKKPDGKFSYFIGFKNNSNGYELRTPPYQGNPNGYKGCFGTKTTTSIKRDKNSGGSPLTSTTPLYYAIFEGFFDFLTFCEEKPLLKVNIVCIVLNSAANVLKVENLRHDVFFYRDRDAPGLDAFNHLVAQNPNIKVRDMSYLYPDHKDYNEFWQAKNKK